MGNSALAKNQADQADLWEVNFNFDVSAMNLSHFSTSVSEYVFWCVDVGRERGEKKSQFKGFVAIFRIQVSWQRRDIC
jgi:hypothetical protein